MTYEYKTVQGYVKRGKVKKLLEDGWEIVSAVPVQIGGVTLTQSVFTLKREKH